MRNLHKNWVKSRLAINRIYVLYQCYGNKMDLKGGGVKCTILYFYISSTYKRRRKQNTEALINIISFLIGRIRKICSNILRQKYDSFEPKIPGV